MVLRGAKSKRSASTGADLGGPIIRPLNAVGFHFTGSTHDLVDCGDDHFGIWNLSRFAPHAASYGDTGHPCGHDPRSKWIKLVKPQERQARGKLGCRRRIAAEFSSVQGGRQKLPIFLASLPHGYRAELGREIHIPPAEAGAEVPCSCAAPHLELDLRALSFSIRTMVFAKSRYTEGVGDRNARRGPDEQSQAKTGRFAPAPWLAARDSGLRHPTFAAGP